MYASGFDVGVSYHPGRGVLYYSLPRNKQKERNIHKAVGSEQEVGVGVGSPSTFADKIEQNLHKTHFVF